MPELSQIRVLNLCQTELSLTQFKLKYLYMYVSFYSNAALNDGDYLITIPRVFRAGTTQNVGINIFGNKSCDVTVTLYDSKTNGKSTNVEGHFKPNEAGVLKVQVSLRAIRNCIFSIRFKIIVLL